MSHVDAIDAHLGQQWDIKKAGLDGMLNMDMPFSGFEDLLAPRVGHGYYAMCHGSIDGANLALG